MRFKEIVKDVRDNAQKVVKLSNEKKEQALNQQKILQEEVNRQTAELRSTLENLKSTQAQLIQSEKMASLGELTAGIAHEIQNPLNFVNNFSEVNNELIEELKSHLAPGETKLKSEEQDDILNDIFQNNEKIAYHGKRADAIVKGMLQHSRTSSGQKEPTDINALAGEYLRLSYHGLRAKDKTFTASFKTDFDENIGKIDIIPQDIGRVLLNLFTNAFYSVTEKNKHHPDNYEPVVSISTRKLKARPEGDDPGLDDSVGQAIGRGKVEMRIRDNGTGIPQKLIDKIFQPFFTTKPTGQGTGLGLSLSYDIITKGHGGEFKVETKEGEFAEFIILLPLQ
jgi:signal transduction histidine kinase